MIALRAIFILFRQINDEIIIAIVLRIQTTVAQSMIAIV